MITLGKLQDLLNQATNASGINENSKVAINDYEQLVILQEKAEWYPLAVIDLDDATVTKC